MNGHTIGFHKQTQNFLVKSVFVLCFRCTWRLFCTLLRSLRVFNSLLLALFYFLWRSAFCPQGFACVCLAHFFYCLACSLYLPSALCSTLLVVTRLSSFAFRPCRPFLLSHFLIIWHAVFVIGALQILVVTSFEFV